jgi:esterase/lipase superfamily enzyme
MANVRVYFATNRDLLPGKRAGVFGKTFNPDGVAALRFGHADFAGAAAPKVEVYPEKIEAGEALVLGSERFLKSLHGVMANGATDTLIFIHGFNVSFMGALAAGADLARQVTVEGRPLNVVVFSWPSDGSVVPLMAYYSDREDARATGPAVARAFLKLRDFVKDRLKPEEYCQRRLHLLAHSMGCYTLRQGLQAILAKEPRSLTRMFDQILLAAPDEDDDAFEREDKLKALPSLGRQVTVYHNPFDRALLVSDTTKTNPDRLGSDGPRLIDVLPKKVVVVDCRSIAAGADDLSRHSYYINSRAVSVDIARVMAGQEPEGFPNREYLTTRRAWRLVGELAGEVV